MQPSAYVFAPRISIPFTALTSAFSDSGLAHTFRAHSFAQAGKPDCACCDCPGGRDPNYLGAEIRHRVSTRPIDFVLQLQLANSGDPIDDPSIARQESGRILRLGVILVDRVSADSEAAERQLMFSSRAKWIRADVYVNA